VIGGGLPAAVAADWLMTAYQVYLPSLVAPDDLIEGNTKMQGSASAALFAGPSLAGLVAQLLGAVTALLGNAVSFLVSAACLLGARPAAPGPVAARRGTTAGRRTTLRRTTLRPEIADGLRLVLGDPQAALPARNATRQQVDAILIAMRQVLDRMLELENFNEAVELLRSIVQMQEKLNDETKQKHKQKLKDLLGE